jgi:hypothetical protein
MQPTIAFTERVRRRRGAIDPRTDQCVQMLAKNPHFAHDARRHGDAASLMRVEQTRAQAPLHVLPGRRKVVHRYGGEPVVDGVDEVETINISFTSIPNSL